MSPAEAQQNALHDLEDLGGIPVFLQEDAQLPNLARIQIASSTRPVHVLSYNPAAAAVLPYLVCFQCGLGAVGREIAILGMRGLDINDPSQKYTLKTLEGNFSGLHLVSLMYVAFQKTAPGTDVGIDLSREYTQAVAMFEAR